MRLSAHDASFLYTETASGPMHGIGISILDGAATYEEIFEFYAQRIHLVPRMRQKLAFVPFNAAHPKWVDDPEFDLANHIKRHEVPAGTRIERAMEEALVLGEPLLDRSKPLWLNYVIENVEGKSLLVQLGHHAFIDGATAVAMSMVLTTPEPNSPPPNDPPAWVPEPAPSDAELWQEAMAENARNAFQQAQNAAQSAAQMVELTGRSASFMQRMTRPVMQAPWNASLIGPKRSLSTSTIDLAEFKSVAKALGSTLNDLVVALVSESAARYLAALGEQAANQYLRLMCPVNVRSGDDDPLAGGGNRVSGMFPVLPAWSMSMAERLATVQEELNDIKTNDEANLLDQLQHLQPQLPPLAMATTLGVGTEWDPTTAAARAPLPVMPRPSTPPPPMVGFNFTCTNVPGPTWTQYVAGHQVSNTVSALQLGGNLGLGSCVNSYDGQLNIMYTADPRLVPQVEQLTKLTEQCYGELTKLAG